MALDSVDVNGTTVVSIDHGFVRIDGAGVFTAAGMEAFERQVAELYARIEAKGCPWGVFVVLHRPTLLSPKAGLLLKRHLSARRWLMGVAYVVPRDLDLDQFTLMRDHFVRFFDGTPLSCAFFRDEAEARDWLRARTAKPF